MQHNKWTSTFFEESSCKGNLLNIYIYIIHSNNFATVPFIPRLASFFCFTPTNHEQPPSISKDISETSAAIFGRSRVSGCGWWMGWGFWGLAWMDRGFLQMSKMTGFFVPTTKSSSTSLVFCACLLFLWKLFFSSHGERERKGIMRFCCLWKTSHVFGATFLCRGFFIP